MKRWYLSLLLLMPFCSTLYAANNLAGLLNKVSLQLQAEQWVTTQTVLITVGVNASVSDKGMEAIQAEVMQNLAKLSDKGDWHITTYQRNLDKSGLENIQISAQARLPQSELATLRTKAKEISKPGITYTIDNVEFTPSDAEIRQANVNLRQNVYQQAKAEVDALNKVYPEQKYYLHQIDFLNNQPVPAPMAMQSNMTLAKVAGESQSLSVGNKLYVQATVVIASFPEQLLTTKTTG